MTDFHLAQLNIARLAAPLDSPQLQDFVDNLEPINALADKAPGFVWRLQSDEGDATALRPFGEDMLVNLSVWHSVDALRDYIYHSDHMVLLRRRSEWFERPRQAMTVLWWIPAGSLPELSEAEARLNQLRANGASQEAFDLGHPFPPPATKCAAGSDVQ